MNEENEEFVPKVDIEAAERPDPVDEPVEEESEAEGPSAEERTRKLLAEVQGLRPIFVGTIDFCREPKRGAEVDALYDELTEYNFCTFSAVRVRAMLEESGALEYVEPEEDSRASDAAAPVEETAGADASASSEEGEYYEITERPEGWWVATEAGIAVVDSFDPLGELMKLLEAEPEFESEYRKVLEAICDEPLPLDALDALVRDDEPMKANRRYVSFILKKLEDRDIAEFKGGWTLTKRGVEACKTAGLIASE